MTKEIVMHSVFTEKEQFFIYATDVSGKNLTLDEWRWFFFQWDQQSFYGTDLREIKYEDKSGLLLSPYHWLKITAEEPFNTMIDWQWDEFTSICLSLGNTIYYELESIDFSKNFYQESVGTGLSEQFADEFQPAFWEQKIKTFWRKPNKVVENIDNENQFLSLGHTMPQTESEMDWQPTVHDFANYWFKITLVQHPKYQQTLKMIQILESQRISKKDIIAFFEETQWSTLTQQYPFSMGVRLIEPNFDIGEDVDGWKLEMFIRDKTNPAELLLWHNRQKAPTSWKVFFQQVEKEVTLWKRLFPWLSDRIHEAKAWLFLTDVAELLMLMKIEVLLPIWWQNIQKARLQVRAKVNSGTRAQSFVGLESIVDFDWKLAIENQEISQDEFNRLVEEKRQFIYSNGQWIKLDTDLMKRMQKIMKEAESQGLSIQDFLQYQLSVTEEEGETDENYPHIQFELNQGLNRFIYSLKNISEIPLVPTPKTFQGTLRPYQVQGMSWLLYLRDYRLGGCLADDMGLGKTVQLIGYLLTLQERNESNQPTLIVCPTSVLGNWQKEFARFAPSLKVVLHYGTSRLRRKQFQSAFADVDVVLTSYGLVFQDEKQLTSIQWNTVVLDEAQNIKNAYTKQSRAARKLRGQHHIAMTGTPIENRLSELWSIYDFINKGFLGSLQSFNQNYVGPIERDGDKQKIVSLQRVIQPFLLRRTKKDEDVALNLPSKLEQKEFVNLTHEQAALYEHIVKETLEKISHSFGFERKGLVLKMLSKLKQVCNHPALFLKEVHPEQIQARSGKTEKLMELLDSIFAQQESVLIFTQFLEMGHMIQKLIVDQYKIEVPFLKGSVPKRQRDEMVVGFQDGQFPVLLLSLKAGGTGLNLTVANHVIHYDRWWNPAVENQATDRAHRIGQTKFVHVHKFISSGTLEEKIDLMLEKKQDLNDEIVQSDNWITELSNHDLEKLLVFEH